MDRGTSILEQPELGQDFENMVRLQNDRFNLNLLNNDSHIPLIEILQDLDKSSPNITEDQARYELPKFNSALNV